MSASPTSIAARSLIQRMERLPFTKFHWILIVTIFIGTAFDNMDQITLSFVIPVYAKEWGLNPLITRWNPILGILGTLIGAILWGRVADKVGRRNAFLYTILIFAGTSLANAFATSFEWVVISCFFMGIGVGGEIPLAFTLISEYVPAKHRGKIEILTGMLAISGGYAIAAFAALLFLPYQWGVSFFGIPLGWRTLFLVGVIPAFLAGFIRRVVPESPRYLISKGKIAEAMKVVERLEAAARVKSDDPIVPPTQSGQQPIEVTVSARDLLAKAYGRRTILSWIYGLTWGFFNFGFLIWLPTLLQRFASLPESEVSFIASVMNAIAIPSAFVTAVLFGRWSSKKTLAIYPIIAGVLMIVLGWVLQGGLVNLFTLIGLGGAIFFTGASLAGAFPPYTSEIYPTELRGTGTGVAVGLSRIGSVIGIAVGGALLAGGAGIFLNQLVFGIPLLLAGAVMLAMGIETRRKVLEEI